MPSYEMVYVLRPSIPDDEVEQAIERVNAIVTSRGGTVEKTDLWGRRRLAYRLQDYPEYREGIYVLTEFSCPPQATSAIEGLLRINEDVMRHLVVRRTKRQ
ncbi:MAG: 30S ribosomal protein S6 [Dehalococcoidia bacterium]|nr:MAG: 30S ribosomal protein S6 [Dehalococcoidia bacterium]